VPKPKKLESVFLNIPYDSLFEDLYVSYIVGLTQLGINVTATLAYPNQDRLGKIIELIERSNFSIHDLSRIEASHGIPRFNMPLELGIALYRSKMTKHRHAVYVFESKAFRAQRSISDINRMDPRIHNSKPIGVMSSLLNLFRQPGDATTVPEMLKSYRAVKVKLPQLRKNAGSKSLFEKATFEDLKLAALIESEKLINAHSRAGLSESGLWTRPVCPSRCRTSAVSVTGGASGIVPGRREAPRPDARPADRPLRWFLVPGAIGIVVAFVLTELMIHDLVSTTVGLSAMAKLDSRHRRSKNGWRQQCLPPRSLLVESSFCMGWLACCVAMAINAVRTFLSRR